ncbi:GNAT family N-acetyltransferase [Phytomonospora sp. NPDC050363]|uniref:GNAT family N-acetyltransferase n=1 Tax=Phytomonospora sp. NPDC050363 TaxID=3155642 RepID=UPI0033FBE87E
MPDHPLVRPATPADYPGMADVQSVVAPFLLISAESLAHYAKVNEGDSPLQVVAELDGRVVGVAVASLSRFSSREGAVGGLISVLPEYRRRGIGSALLERIEGHHAAIGGSTLSSHSVDADGLGFAVKRGFAAGRTGRISRASLDAIPAPAAVPEGIEIRTLSEVDDWRALYETDVAALVDIPSNTPMVPPTYERWHGEILADPRMSTATSVVALDGKTVAALAYLYRVDGRVYSNFTGTHPGYRGRGLAMLVKSHSLHAAREAGVTEAFTINDAENAPMLAVNTKLGYVAFAEQRAVKRAAAGD